MRIATSSVRGIRSDLSNGIRCCRTEPAGVSEARSPLSGPALSGSECGSLADSGHGGDTFFGCLRSVWKPLPIRQRAGHRAPGGLATVPADPCS